MCGQAPRLGADIQSVPPLVRTTHRSLLRTIAAVALTLGVGWSLFGAPPAVAAVPPIVTEQTDPAGDAYYQGKKVESGADITGFSITQDREAKVVRGTVTFAGDQLTAGAHELRIGLGKVEGKNCRVWDIYGIVHIRHDMGTDLGDYIVSAMTDVRKEFPFARAENSVSFETPVGPFDGYGFRCIVVTTEKLFGNRTTDAEHPEDEAIAFAPEDPPAQVNAPLDPGKGTPAPIVDTDGDGVHDAVDKCPAIPGAAMNGCETVPLAKSIKLGTKRLVVDRLLETTNGACPKTVKIVAKLSGKTYGKQAVGTLKKGKFCHVLAVVTLKKKIKKARVTITGTGVTPVAATVAK